MNIYTLLKKLFSKKGPEFFPGILGRGNDENIYPFEDVVGVSSPALFKEKKRTEWRKFPYQFQSSSSSCVTYGTAKICLILYFLFSGRVVKFSPGFWYKSRRNKPGLGMYFDDIQKLASEGALLYELAPCEGFTEDQMNTLSIEQYQRDSAKVFALPKDWVELPIDFDTVASTIEKTRKGVKLWFSFGPGEVFGVERCRIVGSDKRWNHDMTAVDAFTFEGVEYILVEDSADKEKHYQKLIDRNFFKRCYLARYPINFKFAQGAIDKPEYDGTIISVQIILRYEGFFPNNVPLAERVGPVTQDALKKFQKKYGLVVTGVLDTETIKKIKQFYFSNL